MELEGRLCNNKTEKSPLVFLPIQDVVDIKNKFSCPILAFVLNDLKSVYVHVMP